jgi:hypothetical protein
MCVVIRWCTNGYLATTVLRIAVLTTHTTLKFEPHRTLWMSLRHFGLTNANLDCVHWSKQ